MKMRLLYIFTFILIVASIIYWWRVISFGQYDEINQEDSSLAHPSEDVLYIGSVGLSSEAVSEEFEPFAAYLEARLSGSGGGQVEVVSLESAAEAARMMRQGRLDVYIDSPFASYVVVQLAEARPAFARWQSGAETYRSVIFTRESSGITQPADLAGRVIAFEFPDSTSAYFLTKSELLALGMNPLKISDPDESVPEGGVGYYFAGNETAIVEAVTTGAAAAGVLASDDYEKLVHAEIQSAYPVVHTSLEVYRQVVVFRGDLDQHLADRLSVELLGMDSYDQGRSVLDAFEQTARFSPIPEDADLFKNIENLSLYIEEELIK